MPLRDSLAYLVETDTAAASLPGPTTVSGRTHLLVNRSSVPAVWSSVGTTPFRRGADNVATVTVRPGHSLPVQSDGTYWVVTTDTPDEPGPGDRTFFTATGTSDAAGHVTFTFPAGTFTAAPVVGLSHQSGASTNPVDLRVTSVTAASATVLVRQSPTVVVQGQSLLGLPAPLAGAVVHLTATGTGTTP